jgi:hypothetical protein
LLQLNQQREAVWEQKQADQQANFNAQRQVQQERCMFGCAINFSNTPII